MHIELWISAKDSEEFIRDVEWSDVPSVGDSFYLTEYFKDSEQPISRSKFKVIFVDWTLSIDHSERIENTTSVQVHLKRVK